MFLLAQLFVLYMHLSANFNYWVQLVSQAAAAQQAAPAQEAPQAADTPTPDCGCTETVCSE